MLRVACALLFWWIVPATLGAQPLEDAAALLAGRISSLLPRRATVSLEFQNLTALAPAASSSFRSGLENELRKAGLSMTAQPEVRLRVTVSENVRGLLFVAEVFSAESHQVVMLPWNAPPPADEKPRLKLTKKAIWEQAEPVLDFLLLDDGSQLVVLTPTKLSSYHPADGKWITTGTASLTLARPIPRDRRGHIESTPNGIRVYIPGTTCSGPAIKLACTAANESWPAEMHWVTDRNYLESDGARGAFFSAANGLYASLDGRIRDRAGEPIPGADTWGSDIAAMASPCGTSSVLLATRTGESQEQVQAYEISKGQSVPASDPLDLPGPVTALWAQSSGQAALVVRNSKTGNYEASLLGLACTE